MDRKTGWADKEKAECMIRMTNALAQTLIFVPQHSRNFFTRTVTWMDAWLNGAIDKLDRSIDSL